MLKSQIKTIMIFSTIKKINLYNQCMMKFVTEITIMSGFQNWNFHECHLQFSYLWTKQKNVHFFGKWHKANTEFCRRNNNSNTNGFYAASNYPEHFPL